MIVHAFTDGRDTLPHAGAGFLAELDATEGARVGSVVGRYWAMDRDRRWDRTQRAYDLLVHGRAPHSAASGEEAVAGRLRAGGDRRVHRADARRWRRCADQARRQRDRFNFRPDRMRELTRALAEPGFAEFDRDGGEPLRRLRDADRVRGGLALPGRVPAGAPADDARDRAGGGRARGSCTWRRRRSTRT